MKKTVFQKLKKDRNYKKILLFLKNPNKKIKNIIAFSLNLKMILKIRKEIKNLKLKVIIYLIGPLKLLQLLVMYQLILY